MAHAYPKVVESPHYHLWTDALHARALAHQARNKWDRGTYVRWTVTTSWTVLEIARQDALQEPSISYRFRKNLDDAIARRSLPKIDWDRGLWQRVRDVQEIRKRYVHRFLIERDLFPDAEIADHAVKTIREAVVAIYTHAHRVPPAWVQDDEDRGWDKGTGSSACLTVAHKGASGDDPRVVKTCCVYNDRERVHTMLPPGTDPQPYCEDLIRNLNGPASAIRVYEGDNLVVDRPLPMRGS